MDPEWIQGKPVRILFVTKRRTSGKDILADRFGRYFHLPTELGKRGHEVMVAAAAYDQGETLEVAVGGAKFTSTRLSISNLGRYLRHMTSLSTSMAPDVVVGGGDIQFGLVARRLAKRLSIPFVFDVFDNYETFRSGRVPGMKAANRRLMAEADLVVCVSAGLAGLVEHGRVSVIPNGVDLDHFRPAPQGFFAGESSVGYVGGVAANRGIETLRDAVAIVRARGREVRLVIAGPVAKGFRVPSGPWIEYRGVVDQREVPGVIQGLDVAVLPYPSTAWARYSSPYKLLEYLACEVPVVVTNVSAFRSLLTSDEAVCVPGDPGDMARAIEHQLINRVVVPRNRDWSWKSRAEDLERAVLPLTEAGIVH